MKKILCRLSCIICLLVLLCPVLMACDGNSNTVTQNGIQYKKVTLHSNGEATECYYVAGCDSKIVKLNIASKIKGLPVLGFMQSAFKGNTKLKEVTIPDSITSISLNSVPFIGCNNIEKLTLATSDVEKLFKGYGSGDENNTEPLPKSLKRIYLTSACTRIKTRSFRYCRYLQEVHIPSSVTTIEDGTNSISIGVNGNTPSGRFEDLPFLGCENLTIYCENQLAPSGWGKYWNYIDSSTEAKVVWNGYNNSQQTSNSSNTSDNTNTGYRLLATLDKSKISSYNGWTTIKSENTGAVSLTPSAGYTDPAFIWDLSEYSFSMYNEYMIKFENLAISEADAQIQPTLRLNWQDSSFSFLKYYNTSTQLFSSNLDNKYLRLSLDELTYETYTIKFNFDHYSVTTAPLKKLYFDFDGVKSKGTLSFDQLSIYYIEK